MSHYTQLVRYSDLGSFPATGDSSLLYIANDTVKTYVWNGSAYAPTNAATQGWDGEANTYADLPAAASHSGEVWLVLSPSGIWPLNHPAGLYISDGAAWNEAPMVAGAVTTSGSLIDNCLIRGDGTTQIQSSGITVDDSNNITGVGSFTAGAITGSSFVFSGGLTNGRVLIGGAANQITSTSQLNYSTILSALTIGSSISLTYGMSIIDNSSNTTYVAGQTSSNYLILRWNYNATPASAYAELKTFAGSNNLILQADGGNVGIGTTSATEKLTVSGNASISGSVIANELFASTSAGLLTQSQNGTDVALFGIANTANCTFYGTLKLDASTASRILSTDASSNITALDTSTYPSLTELSYVKGVTSSIQTQLNAITSGYVTSITGTADQVIASASTGAVTLSLPQSIASTSSPTFAGLSITGKTGGVIPYFSGGTLTTSAAFIFSSGVFRVGADIGVANGMSFGDTTLSVESAIGQGSSNKLQFVWNYNATASSAYAEIKTKSGNNDIRFMGEGGKAIFANTALALYDTAGNNYVQFKINEDQAADRTLNWILGASDRTITLSGNPTLNDWFDQNVKTTGTPTFARLDVDNVRLDGNTISTTDASGIMVLDTNGGSIALVDNTVCGASGTALTSGFTTSRSSNPRIWLYETGAAADSKIWEHLANSGTYRFRVANDALTNSVSIYDVTRSGLGSLVFTVPTATVTISSLLNVDNLRLDGNTLSSTNTNGNITLAPNGTGLINYGGASTSGGFQGIDESTYVSNNTEFLLIKTSNGAGVWGYKGSSNNAGSLIFKTHSTQYTSIAALTLWSDQNAIFGGNILIGSASNDYRRIRMGGGNQYGYLFTSFPGTGDGIELGYNFYYDSSGTGQIGTALGGTAYFQVGYGEFRFYAANAGTGNPTQKAIMNGDGNWLYKGSATYEDNKYIYWGTGQDSCIGFDGSDTVWNLQNAGTGKLFWQVNDTRTNGALELVQYGTGDAAMMFTIAGVFSYSIGVDNSDSDKFKICASSAIGTNDAITIDSSSLVTVANLAISQTPSSAAAIASTHKLPISLNGSTYYILLTNV